MVNPPTTATLLLGLSKRHVPGDVRRQVNMAALYLFSTLCVSFFIGSILDLFGISIPGLGDWRAVSSLASSAFACCFLPWRRQTVDPNQNIAFVPLTMPSLCGSVTMALVISGAAQIAELPAEYSRLTISSYHEV